MPTTPSCACTRRSSANIGRIPVGIPEPLIVGRGINDVAAVVLTLSPKPEAAARWTEKDLYQVARELQYELVKTDNVGLTYISGGNPQQIRVEPDPEKLALYGVTLQQLVGKVREANRSFQAGSVRDNGITRDVAAGQTLAGIPDIGMLLVTTRDGRPVYVRDVATVVIGPSPQEHRVWMDTPEKGGHWDRVPAVSVAFAKRAGANAVVVAEQLLARLQHRRRPAGAQGRQPSRSRATTARPPTKKPTSCCSISGWRRCRSSCSLRSPSAGARRW